MPADRAPVYSSPAYASGATHRRNLSVETRFEVGAVIRDTFSLFFANAKILVMAAILIQAPYVLVSAISQASQAGSALGAFDPTSLLFFMVEMLLGLVLGSIASGAVCWAAASSLRGERVTVVESINAALPLAPVVIGVTIITSFLAGLGSLFFLIPGIIVALMLWVAVPAAVVERAGVFDALGRSRDLTEGRRLKILGAVFVFFLIIMVPALVLIVPLAVFVGVSGEAAAAGAMGLFSALFSVAVSSLSNTFQLYVYHELRREKEGTGVGDVAAVFD